MLLTGLTLIFVTAKLLGYVDWSWWLVLLPGIIKILMTIVSLAVVFVGVSLGKEINLPKK
jgi:hypothetical protein